MTPAALRLARLLAARRGEVGEIARALLEAEGIDVDQPPPANDVASRSKAAERMARIRAERRANTPANRGEHQANKSEHVREQGANIGEQPLPLSCSPSLSPLSVSSEILETSEREELSSPSLSGNARGANTMANVRANTNSEQANANTVNEPTSGTFPVNAMGDGAFGMLVTAWADGIRSVTGSPFPPPRGRAGGQLSDTLKGVCAGAEDTCGAAFDAGAEYARLNKGRTLSPFHFGDWLGSGKPDANAPRVFPKPEGPLTSDGLDPNSFEASQRRKKREREEREAEIQMRLAESRKAKVVQ